MLLFESVADFFEYCAEQSTYIQHTPDTEGSANRFSRYKTESLTGNLTALGGPRLEIVSLPTGTITEFYSSQNDNMSVRVRVINSLSDKFKADEEITTHDNCKMALMQIISYIRQSQEDGTATGIMCAFDVASVKYQYLDKATVGGQWVGCEMQLTFKACMQWETVAYGPLPPFTSRIFNTWLHGEGAPENDTGIDGDFYVDIEAGDPPPHYYLKVAGAWVDQGEVGAQGPAGADGADGADGTNGTDGAPGSVWRDGSGAPSNGLGINGDYYLNTANGDVYFKAAGSYSVVGNIKGATGATGATGAAGATGATGPAGPSTPSANSGNLLTLGTDSLLFFKYLATEFGAFIDGLTGKTTPVDADYLPLMDSAASNTTKKLSWANLKATLKTYFDTLYPAETTSTLGATINGASSATPNDTDLVATVESSVVKKITWTAVKAFLKTYFDTLYHSSNVGHYLVLKSFTGNTVTGTTSESIIISQLITGGTFAANDVPEFSSSIHKTGTNGTVVLKVYINTSNVLAGATLVYNSGTIANNARSINFTRKNSWFSSSTNLKAFGGLTTAINTDDGAAAPVGAVNIAWTVANDYYFIVTVTPASSSDTFNPAHLIILNKR